MYIAACVLRECEPSWSHRAQQRWRLSSRHEMNKREWLLLIAAIYHSVSLYSLAMSFQLYCQESSGWNRFSKSVRDKMTKWHVLIFSAVLVLLYPGPFQLVWSLFLSNRHSICDIKQEREVKLVRCNSQILFVTLCEGGLQGLLFFKLDERENGFKVQLGDKDEQSLKRPCCLS